MQKITTFLWFDGQAEEAARLYTSIFKNARLGEITRYPEGSPVPAGTVLTAEFEIEGRQFTGLNGGPMYKFSEAMSLYVNCENQAEVDYLWGKLSDGGSIQMCGWLKDRFGVSWQIIPTALPRLMKDPDKAKATRVMQAMMGMKKIDIAALEAAYAG